MSTPEINSMLVEMHPPTPIIANPVESSALWVALNAVTSATNSGWIQVQPFSNFAIECLGTGTFSVQLVGSLSEASPDVSNVTGSNIGSSISTTGITFETFKALRWLQVQATVSSGNLTVNISATAP